MRRSPISWWSFGIALLLGCARKEWRPTPVTPTPRERTLLGCWQVPTGIREQTLKARLDSLLVRDSLPQRSQRGLVFCRDLWASAPAPPGDGPFIMTWAVHLEADSTTVNISYGQSGHQFVGAIEPDRLVGRVGQWSDLVPTPATWRAPAIALRVPCARGAA